MLRLNGLNVTGDDAGTQSRNTFNFQEIGRFEGNRMRVKHERVKDDDLDGQTNGRGGIVSETQVKKTQQRSECGHEAVRSEWKAFRRSAERNRERRDRGICKGRTELAESQVKGASRRRRRA